MLQMSHIVAQAPTSPIVLNNNMLRFGTGSENSINATGNLQQPFYRAANGDWRKLTYYIYPLDFEIMEGGNGTNWWNRNGSGLYNPVLHNQTFDYSKYTQTAGGGYGTIITSGTITLNGKLLQVTHEYELPQDKFLIKITTTLKNLSSETMTNLRYWVGTQDDYIGNNDWNNKTKGNIIDGEFVAISHQSERAKALKIYNNNEGVLFYTNSDQANTIVGQSYGWYNIQSRNPEHTPINVSGDNSYAFYVRFDDLAPQTEAVLNWYYAAGTITDLEQIIRDVYDSVQLSGNITNTSMEFEISETRDANTYYVVLPCSDTAPSVQHILLGQKADGTNAAIAGMVTTLANQSQTVTIDDLNPGTCYKLYIVVEYNEEERVVVDPISFETTNRYSFIFDTAGGSAIETITQTAGTPVTPPASPTKTGHTFIGWDEPIPTTMSSEDHVFTALWQINTYTLTLNCCGSDSLLTQQVVYNELIDVPATPIREGYTFDGWYKEAGLVNAWDFTSDTMPASSLTLYAKWVPNTDTAYRVEHYQQNISDDGYTLFETQQLHGTTGTNVSSVAQTYVGFTDFAAHPSSVLSGIIAADGSLVLQRFYTRTVHSVVFKDYDDTEIESMSLRYGSALVLPSDPSRVGYTFNGWDQNIEVVTSDLILSALYLFNPIVEVNVSDSELDVHVHGLDDAVVFSDDERQMESRVKLEISVFDNLVLPGDVDILNDFILNTLNMSSTQTLMLDISLFKLVGEERIKLTHSLSTITISFLIPEAFYDKEFKLVHIHGGEAQLLEFEYDPQTHVVTFTTDKFSTFALLYDNEEKIPATSDAHAGWMGLWLLLAGLLVLSRKNKNA